MLPNPFSEEDAQRYIAEFKSWPHEFPPDQLVYAGFRSAATPLDADLVTCYGCNLNMREWRQDYNTLEEHLKQRPACPIALKIQQSKWERDEEIKQTTLDQLDRQMEIRRHSAKNTRAGPLQEACPPHVGNTQPLEMPQEAYLLQFHRDKGKGIGSSQWYLSSYATKVMPLFIGTPSASKTWAYASAPGLCEAIMAVLGKGGIMNGWFVYTVFFGGSLASRQYR